MRRLGRVWTPRLRSWDGFAPSSYKTYVISHHFSICDTPPPSHFPCSAVTPLSIRCPPVLSCRIRSLCHACRTHASHEAHPQHRYGPVYPGSTLPKAV